MALICSDVEQTIQFYQGVVGFPLVELMENRDYKGSTHLFFDIGNDNLLAFFDFPGLGLQPGVEASAACSTSPSRRLPRISSASRLDSRRDGVTYLGPDRGVTTSIYFKDPDGIQIELIAEPLRDHGRTRPGLIWAPGAARARRCCAPRALRDGHAPGDLGCVSPPGRPGELAARRLVGQRLGRQTRVSWCCSELVVGVVAVRAETAPDGAMPARVALALDARTDELARALVDGALDLIADAGGDAGAAVGARARRVAPARRAPKWASAACAPSRICCLAASVPTPVGRAPDGWHIRVIRDGEDADVLAALNRAWVGTWNFVAITSRNARCRPEGSARGHAARRGGRRWRRTDHRHVSRGLRSDRLEPRRRPARVDLESDRRAGVPRPRRVAHDARRRASRYLRQRGATSVTLGVDADNPAPFTLYQSVGFEIDSSVEAWDATVEGK